MSSAAPVARHRAPETGAGRRRVARCADPAHLDEHGVCVRWAHLPGDGIGPVKPNFRRRARSFVTRAARHVLMVAGILLAIWFAVRVVGPSIWGGVDLPSFDGGGVPSDVPTGDGGVKPEDR